MTISTYDIGDQVRATGTFTDIDGIAADPTTITFTYRIDEGTPVALVYGTDLAVKRSGTGVYYVDLTIATAGTYFMRWAGTGTTIAAGEDYFEVRKSRVI